MSPIKTLVGSNSRTYSLAFHPDRIHLLSGNGESLRRWRVEDGKEVGRQMTQNSTDAISVSKDEKWIVCGSRSRGASVWDVSMEKKTIQVEDKEYVGAVDISPDSARFATGTGLPDKKANIWDIKTGERLLGPLQQDDYIGAVKFSANGEQIAIAIRNQSILVLDSHNGDHHITIKARIPSGWAPLTPIAWSDDGQRIFAACGDLKVNKIKTFDVSTGSQLAAVQLRNDGGEDHMIVSIALAANGKFLATFSSTSISFRDASALTQIGPVIEDSQRVASIALSPDCRYLATGGVLGNITIRDLSGILPDTYRYDPFHAPSTPSVHDTNPPDSTTGQPATSSPPKSRTHSADGEDDLLEVELQTSQPGPMFDYDEPPSPTSSSHGREVEVMPPASSQVISSHRDTVEPSGGIPVVKRWLHSVMKRSEKIQGSHQLDQHSREPNRPADSQSRSQSQTRGNTANERPSRMAATQRVPRTVSVRVGGNLTKQKRAIQPKAITRLVGAAHPNKNASSSGQGHADTRTADLAQPVNDASQPLAATGIHVTEEAGDAKVSITFRLPGWMCGVSRGTEDGRH